MAKFSYKNGITSVVLRVKIMDSTSTTGGAKTGLTSASSGLIISTIADNEATATAYTVAGSTIETITTLGTFAAPTATKCRFKEVDSTNHAGLYEIQIADARWAVSNARSVIVTVSGATGAAQVDAEVQLGDVPADINAIKGNTTISSAATVPADVVSVSGDTGAADNLETMLDGTGGGELKCTVVGNLQGTADRVTLVDTCTTNTDMRGTNGAYTGTPPTADENADALIARNIAGGSSTGRTVGEALAASRNRVTRVGSTLTVYDTDDVTPLWVATIGTDAAAETLTSIDPT